MMPAPNSWYSVINLTNNSIDLKTIMTKVDQAEAPYLLSSFAGIYKGKATTVHYIFVYHISFLSSMALIMPDYLGQIDYVFPWG